MTTQDQDDIESLHESQSALCAKAAADGIVVSEELLADFDTAEEGRAIVARLEGVVADTSGGVEVTDKPKAKSKSKSPAKKAKATRVAVKTETQQQESVMSKKVKAKKAVKKTAKKKAAKRDGTTSAKVIAMIRRKGGATRGQILSAIGWKAISVQQVAAGQGVKLKVDTSKRPFHYIAA